MHFPWCYSNTLWAGKGHCKKCWVNLISEAVRSRLKNDSSPASKLSLIILNTEVWKNSDTDDEFIVEATHHYTSIFKCPWSELGSAGLCHRYVTVIRTVAKSVVMNLSPAKAQIMCCLAQNVSIKLKWFVASCFIASRIIVFTASIFFFFFFFLIVIHHMKG